MYKHLSQVIATSSRSAIWESWFQQDGATPHTATATIRYLDGYWLVETLFLRKALFYGCHVLRTSVHLPSLCGDTTKTMWGYFFLWWYYKDKLTEFDGTSKVGRSLHSKYSKEVPQSPKKISKILALVKNPTSFIKEIIQIDIARFFEAGQ